MNTYPARLADPDVTISIELVRRAQGGEHDALERLCERYYERLRRIVRARLGARLRNVMDSSDVLQETFVAAVQGFERFEVRDEASFLHWLAKIAENKVRAAGRHALAGKRDKRREVALEQLRASLSSGSLTLEPVADGPLPIDELADAEQSELVEDALADLHTDHREVIVLRTYAGASWEGVAELMERPSADAARMLHARAIVELTSAVRKRLTP